MSFVQKHLFKKWCNINSNLQAIWYSWHLLQGRTCCLHWQASNILQFIIVQLLIKMLPQKLNRHECKSRSWNVPSYSRNATSKHPPNTFSHPNLLNSVQPAAIPGNTLTMQNLNIWKNHGWYHIFQHSTSYYKATKIINKKFSLQFISKAVHSKRIYNFPNSGLVVAKWITKTVIHPYYLH